jgi:hypothetical protein
MAANRPVKAELDRRSPTFDGRLLAEAVRASESHFAEPPRDERAEHVAMQQRDDLETRIVARAEGLPVAGELGQSLRRVRQAIVIALIIATLASVIAGVAAARASLAEPRGQPVNIFWAIGGLLGIQILLLVVWLILMFRGTSALASSSLGGLVVSAARWLSQRHRPDSTRAAALGATGATLASGRLGRWTFSAISHWLWVAFNLACLAMLLAMLSTRHYTFMWETTILGEATFTPLTRAIAWLPEKLGFTVPETDQIAAARWPVEHDVAQRDRHPGLRARPIQERQDAAWAGLLVGSIVAYGLLPRIILLAISLARRMAAKRSFRLDLNAPEYARLQPILTPTTTHLGVVDRDDGSVVEYDAARHRPSPSMRSIGPAAVLGLELQRPPATWPPRIDASSPMIDLGRVDDGRSRSAAIRALRESNSAPRAVVVIAELTTTPDRGHQAFLADLQAAAGRPVSLVLTAGDALRHRGERELVEHRVEDWLEAARHAGISRENVHEIDLDHLTEATAARLHTLAAPATPHSDHDAAANLSPFGSRRIEPAFDLIAEHAGRWRGTPGMAARAELHRGIGMLYRSEQNRWSNFLRVDESTTRDWHARLHAGAQRVSALLPAGLRLDAKWLAAGAAAGALGCVAAATLLSPAAIASLPMWSGLGALITTVITPRRSAAAEPSSGDESDLTEAVRSAALFAMLLELQGRGEGAISSVLERAITPDLAAATIRDAADARAWLDQLRHEFDLALAGERSA